MIKSFAERIRDLKDKAGFQRGFLLCEILIVTGIMISLLFGRGVDWDEVFTIRLVTGNQAAGVIAATAADVHPPLYYLIVKFFTVLLGTDLKVFAGVSVLPTVFSMLLAAVFIRKRWGFLTSALTILGFGLEPYLLFYSCEIRMYSWMNFFVLGALLMTREIIEEKKKRYWLFLFLFGVCAVYTQYFSFLPVLICYVYLLFALLGKHRKRTILNLILLCTADMICYLPWIGILCRQLKITEKPVKGYTFQFSPLQFFTETFSVNPGAGPFLIMLLFVMSLFFLVMFHKKFVKEEIHFLVMLLCNVLFCFFVSQAVGSLNGHFFSFRYIIYCVSFIWIILTAVYTRISLPVRLNLILFSVLLGISGYGNAFENEYGMNQEMARTDRFIRENIAPDAEMVYNMPTFDALFDYYVPGHRLIYLDDLKLKEMYGKTFWLIRIGSRDFAEEDKKTYQLRIEDYEGFGYAGMKHFALEKITVPQK